MDSVSNTLLNVYPELYYLPEVGDKLTYEIRIASSNVRYQEVRLVEDVVYDLDANIHKAYTSPTHLEITDNE